MHDVRNGILFDDMPHGGFIAQIAFSKTYFGCLETFLQIFQMSGVSKAVEIDQPRNSRPVNDMVDDI